MARVSSLFRTFQTGSGAHSASYSVGAESAFPGGMGKKGLKLTAHSISVYPLSLQWDNISFTCFHFPSSSVSLTFHYLLLPNFLCPLLSSHSSYILLPTLRLGSDLGGYTSRNLATNKSKFNFVHRWMCYLFSAHHTPVRASNNIQYDVTFLRRHVTPGNKRPLMVRVLLSFKLIVLPPHGCPCEILTFMKSPSPFQTRICQQSHGPLSKTSQVPGLTMALYITIFGVAVNKN